MEKQHGHAAWAVGMQILSMNMKHEHAAYLVRKSADLLLVH
jgi:hypothetical protein